MRHTPSAIGVGWHWSSPSRTRTRITRWPIDTQRQFNCIDSTTLSADNILFKSRFRQTKSDWFWSPSDRRDHKTHARDGVGGETCICSVDQMSARGAALKAPRGSFPHIATILAASNTLTRHGTARITQSPFDLYIFYISFDLRRTAKKAEPICSFAATDVLRRRVWAICGEDARPARRAPFLLGDADCGATILTGVLTARRRRRRRAGSVQTANCA